MRRPFLLALALAACVLPAAGSSASGANDSGAPVYAVTGDIGEAAISRRNPRTLTQVGPAVPLGAWEHGARLSPDGSLLALVAGNSRPLSLRFLDLVRIRWGRTVVIPYWSEGRWIAPDKLVVLGEHPDGVRAAIVDAARGRIVRQTRIRGHLADRYAEPTPAGTAMLLRPLALRELGPALVGVIRPSGAVRIVELDRILSGSAERSRRPAVIADPETSRAYVFGGLDEPVAEIDLRTLAVRYHDLRGPQPLADTLGNERFGAWLGSGRLALGGWDDSKTDTLRLGLSIVDTRTWRMRRLDGGADFFATSGDLLVGLRLDGSLSAFGSDGRRRFSVSDQVFQLGTVSSNGRYVYAYNLGPGSKGAALVVDARSGRKVSWLRSPLYGPLISPGFAAPGT